MMKTENKRILILATHFDDEVLSFGGLIHREVRQGHEVYVHIFTAGGPCSNVSSEVRIQEFSKVMDYLGVDESHRSYEGVNMDGRLDQIPSCLITGQIDYLVERIHPHEVYCSSNSEHADHHRLYEAFLGAARLKSGWQPRLWAVGTYMFSNQLYSAKDGGLMYQPLSEDDFNAKCEAFKLYKSQFKPSPNPLGLDGIKIMAEYYGMLCGHKYAELFYQLRYIRDI